MDWLHDSVESLRAAYDRDRKKPIPSWAAWDEIEGNSKPLRILRHKPPGWEANQTLIVYFHGGGWIVGSPETHADITASLSLSVECELLSVDYRLAPEHVAPAPVMDGLKVLEYLLAGSAQKIILCGDSAGGAIALAVERAVPPHIRQHISGVCSFYGYFGGFTGNLLLAKGDRLQGTDRECLLRYWSLAHANGVASPYSLENLSQPSQVPVYLLAASEDPMFGDTLELTNRLSCLDRLVTLDIAEGETHGFLHDGIESQAVYQTIELVREWSRKVRSNGRNDF
ncbi:MAG TPA: alpha/beta hydrolase fold domain-containing protein [Aestuariivirga sp.]|nr:alpha/beta hydrolase fold domain-containing protein [Aestuariivirga sp.]